MRAFILGLLFLGLTSLCFAQEDGKLLSEVEVYATNYDYLKSVKSNNIHPAISILERNIAKFDVTDLRRYREDFPTYEVGFYYPKGKGNVMALYDNKSNILRTSEKYKGVELPSHIVKSVLKLYPECNIDCDLFLVTYHHKKGVKKTYKINVLNKDKKIKVKTDENGNIL